VGVLSGLIELGSSIIHRKRVEIFGIFFSFSNNILINWTNQNRKRLEKKCFSLSLDFSWCSCSILIGE